MVNKHRKEKMSSKVGEVWVWVWYVRIVLILEAKLKFDINYDLYRLCVSLLFLVLTAL